MVTMGEVATITSKSMVTIPARLMRKYGFKQGSKLEFVEVEEGLLVIPVRTLRELRGAGKQMVTQLVQAVKELEKEHREEARR